MKNEQHMDLCLRGKSCCGNYCNSCVFWDCLWRLIAIIHQLLHSDEQKKAGLDAHIHNGGKLSRLITVMQAEPLGEQTHVDRPLWLAR